MAVDRVLTWEHAFGNALRAYTLTSKGIDLAPVLAEMVLWAARHEATGNQALVRELQKNKRRVVAKVRQHWARKTNASTS